MRTPWKILTHRRRWTAAAMALGVALVGCEAGEADIEPDETAEVATVEREPGEAEIELEEALPFSPEDVGDLVIARGTVIGQGLTTGFFIETEMNRVLFVDSEEQVSPGQVVEVAGPVGSVTTAIFDEWERDALQGEVEVEWDILQDYFIDANRVTPLPS